MHWTDHMTSLVGYMVSLVYVLGLDKYSLTLS